MTYNGQVLTIKTAIGGTDVLIAPGPHRDIPRDGPDHVHLWGLTNADFRLHDLRHNTALFPQARSEFKRPVELDRQQDVLVERAKALLIGPVDKRAFEAAKALQAEWKTLGKASPRNTHAFRAAMDEFFAKRKVELDRKSAEWEKRAAQWATNKAAKERVVGQAETLASTVDLKGSGVKMKALFEDFKKIGPADKQDNDRLWERFKAAQTRLRARNDELFAKRKAEWAANKAARERLVGQMRALANGWETRGLVDQAKALQSQWRTVGHCDRADEDVLWAAFRAATDTVFQKVKSAAAQRAWARVQDLEIQLREAESNVFNARDQVSQSLNTRTPSFTNPHFSSILAKQSERQAKARDRLMKAEARRDRIVGWLVDAKSQANRS